MNNYMTFEGSMNVEMLTQEECKRINGGFWAQLLIIGAAAGAALAIYELGKSTGEFIYHATR